MKPPRWRWNPTMWRSSACEWRWARGRRDTNWILASRVYAYSLESTGRCHENLCRRKCVATRWRRKSTWCTYNSKKWSARNRISKSRSSPNSCRAASDAVLPQSPHPARPLSLVAPSSLPAHLAHCHPWNPHHRTRKRRRRRSWRFGGSLAARWRRKSLLRRNKPFTIGTWRSSLTSTQQTIFHALVAPPGRTTRWKGRKNLFRANRSR